MCKSSVLYDFFHPSKKNEKKHILLCVIYCHWPLTKLYITIHLCMEQSTLQNSYILIMHIVWHFVIVVYWNENDNNI